MLAELPSRSRIELTRARVGSGAHTISCRPEPASRYVARSVAHGTARGARHIFALYVGATWGRPDYRVPADCREKKSDGDEHLRHGRARRPTASGPQQRRQCAADGDPARRMGRGRHTRWALMGRDLHAHRRVDDGRERRLRWLECRDAARLIRPLALAEVHLGTHVQLQRGGAAARSAPSEVWKRCKRGVHHRTRPTA